MAIYKTTSSKVIIRKIFRDLNPSGDNWVDDAIEWIGEALEHIGSAAQLEKKTCVISIKNFKGSLPSNLSYINQVAVNSASSPAISSELDVLLSQIDDLNYLMANDPTINLTSQIRDFNVRAAILENIYMTSAQGLLPLSYCTTNFPEAADCPTCSQEFIVGNECYYVENGRIKTSFANGLVCLSYMAFPVDDDGYPLVPDDISFKEAMFWYVYKKLLLGNTNVSAINIDYTFAETQWKYYCTQARNAANYPDIDRYESFLDQWVRLIPNINRHAELFGTLNVRENLYRGKHNRTNIESLPSQSTLASGSSTPTGYNSVQKVSVASWVTSTTAAINVAAGSGYLTLNLPQAGEVNYINGAVQITNQQTYWSIIGLLAGKTIQYSFVIESNSNAATTDNDISVQAILVDTSNNTQYVISNYDYNTSSGATTFSGIITHINTTITNAQLYLKIKSDTVPLNSTRLLSGQVRIQ